MITLKELAVKCGVSIATVSNILNGKSNVSEATRKRILKIIEESGYKPNYLARGLRATKSKTIGLIMDDLTAFSSPELVEGIMNYCEKKGYKVIIENLRLYSKYPDFMNASADFIADVHSAINQMLAIRVDGIIYVGAFSRKIDYIPQDIEIPVVISYALSDVFPSVSIKDKTSAQELTEYLINKGYSRFGVITGLKENVHGINRYEGFKRALMENGFHVNEDFAREGDWTKEGGYNACKQLPSELFDKSEKTAIFCFNDEMAVGVYEYLSELNLKPGIDIGVTGFDCREFASYLNPSLTTMEIPLKDIGESSAELILKKINGIESENKVSVPCRLIKGNSD